jgi:hypothetical protein
MAKQTWSPGQVLTAASLTTLQANDYNWTVDTKTDSYVLVAGDAGKRIVMNAATAKTITVNTSIFTAGDVVWIHNINTGTATVTAGTATVNTAGSLALAQWEGGALYFTSASSAIFFRGGGSSYGVATGGSSSSITVGGQNYTLLTFTGDGTLTVTKAGLFDILVCAGGGGGGKDQAGGNGYRGGGGGAGGLLNYTGIYLSANQTVTIGAGGAAASADNTNGNLGGFSRVGSFYAIGGGGGLFESGIDPSGNGVKCAGGSAGGGTKTSGWSSGNQGNLGGSGIQLSSGGGGGGSGAVGVDSTANVGGNGGAGTDVSTFIGGSSLFKAAGGGGAGNTTGGTGGSSIGGNGSFSSTNATAAGANTASGGGGAGANRTAAAGGSGIVYVRFKV